ncbi:hypothetical protein COCOBI_17-2530 [Coccomyxa sp. Obi]|nr:hypothetical protein COCOBI_17-2530 [Coccomyxa sp. Obi]
MRPALMNLRVLVLDYCNYSCDYCGWVHKMKDPRAQLPKLETLIIQNVNGIMPSFSLFKCPRLANLAVGFLQPAQLPWLRSFLGSSGGRLKTLQLQLSLLDEDIRHMEEEDHRADEWDSLPDHVRAMMYAITGGRSRAPPRGRPKRRPRFQGVFKALRGAEKLEHLQLVFRGIPTEIAASVIDVEIDSLAVLPKLATLGIFEDYNEGQNYSFSYGPATERGTVKNFCKAFGRLQLAGFLPALRKVYFHPVERASREFYGEVKAMTGTEGFKAVALKDPGRAMGKAWLRGAPGAKSSKGLSRAAASMNFDRGLIAMQCKLNSAVHHPLRARNRYLFVDPDEDASDDEGFGQNADLDDGQLTAPGMSP